MGDFIVQRSRASVGRLVVGGPTSTPGGSPPAGSPPAGSPPAGSPPASGDPEFGNVIFLSDFEGSDGSTTLNEQSPFGRSIVFGGGSSISNTQAKYGSTSVSIGTLSGITVDSETGNDFELAANDFTLEMDVYFTLPFPRTVALWSKSNDLGFGLPSNSFLWTVDGSTMQFGIAVGGNPIYDPIGNFAFTPTLNQWVHLAVVRQGDNFYAWEDGTLLGTNTNFAGKTVFDTAFANPRIGDTLVGAGSVNGLGGFVDNARATLTARYTAPFTPPTGPHPTST